MNILSSIALIVAVAGSSFAHAQHGDNATLPAYSAPAEAHQFDFLIGQWEIELTPKVGGLVAMIHGAPRLIGSWKAWPAFDGFGIEDELRVMDASGNPATLNHALRVYDSAKGQWTITGMDIYRALASQSSGNWQEGEMHIKGAGTARDGSRYLSRTRFFDISADGFRMQQDRSTDGGETWEEASLAIVAKRVAAVAPR